MFANPLNFHLENLALKKSKLIKTSHVNEAARISGHVSHPSDNSWLNLRGAFADRTKAEKKQKTKKHPDCSHHVSWSWFGCAKFAEVSTKQFSIICWGFIVGVMMKAGLYLTEGPCLLVDNVQSESNKGSFECGR